MKKNKFNFEKSINELEQLTGQLEQGDLTLEEMVKLYTDGCTLAQQCQEALNQAEQKVQILENQRLKTFSPIQDEPEPDLVPIK